jgi:hypothetical protein
MLVAVSGEDTTEITDNQGESLEVKLGKGRE